MSERPSFFSELKRRNVYKVAVAYAVVGWLIAQIATQIFPFFEIPNWIVRLVIVLIAIGFPIALVIAWGFEATPEGIKKTAGADAEHERSRGKTWIYVVIIGASVSVALFFVGRYTAGNNTSVARTQLPAKSIAVLPFENLSDDRENAYLAEGIQDEILTKLATIADLKVISRMSAAKYASKPDDVKSVSQQLGAARLLEGTVQKVGDKVRVNVQLIDASSDSHLWAKSYDGQAKDVFTIESTVAQEVADLLQAKLSSAETKRLITAPTSNAEAYDIFLKAEFEQREAESSLTAEDFDRAAVLYRDAISHDPNFALAHARLVMNRMERHWYNDRLSDAELRSVENEARHAIELAPQLADTHVALGTVFYFGYRRYDEALAEFHKAIDLQPNAGRALEYSAYVHRRLGRWNECISDLEKSIEEDPRNSILVGELAVTYCQLRMWAQAGRFAHKSLELETHNATAMLMLLYRAINAQADVNEARRLLQTFPQDVGLPGQAGHMHTEGLLGLRAFVSVLEKNFSGALNVFENGAYGLDERRRECGRLLVYLFAGKNAEAAAEAGKVLPSIEVTLQRSPDDLDALIEGSWVYLALNRGNDSHEMATRAAQVLSPEKDALVGTFTAFNLAEIDARTGRTADAVHVLQDLLSRPAGLETTVASLKLHPAWDPIRNAPEFQQLFTMKEHVGP